ncbi:ribosome recycling factor [bacterium]|nr:MAG: ribosome recycling factor [bacterium]
MVAPELSDYYETAKLEMEEAIEFLKREFSHVRAGKASPELLAGVRIDYYGSLSPINQVANVTAPEPRMIVVQPWDKSMIGPIERAIQSAGLGLNPSNDGTLIRVPLPLLTEDRRKELVKVTKDIAEHARVSIRNARREANDHIKKAVKNDGVSEDLGYDAEQEVQKLTDNFIKEVETLFEKKEKDILTV